VLEEAIHTAQKSGVLVVAAAGNDGSDAAHYPAAMAQVISVAAQAESSSGLAGFSTRGKWVDVAAPGERVVSALPCGYGTWSGTSTAAPFVSGGAAVLLQLRPKVKPAAVVKALGEGSDKLRGLHNGAMNLSRSIARLK
jgi:subtilisin family serine protease